ncbi:MAG: DinB family protein [Candidatus Solibacter sp.]|nr:DinB family protein [Candidatus Solibacter sp.]
MTGTIAHFEELLKTVPQRLADVADEAAAHKPGGDRWSKKEILGHLIDSAANNHQRFVRAQSAGRLEFPGYEQEFWVATQSYATESWADLVNLWLLLNRHLLHVVKAMPGAMWSHECVIGGRPAVTLEALIIDYLRHLDQHLAQLLGQLRTAK